MGITFNPTTKIISITSPTTVVTIQELVNATRTWEASEEGMQYNKVIDATGKDDLGDSVFTGITMTLSSTWQVQFWSGVGLGVIKSGNLVGGVGGIPIAATGGADSIYLINQVGGTIANQDDVLTTNKFIALK